ncbi:MAG: T9SS type A sorting domain-containing protein [Ignavibacteriaceae bacterium]|nr:T9SS type A sorting domain-containing protein [Ignavibacteriaceae bacterium]
MSKEYFKIILISLLLIFTLSAQNNIKQLYIPIDSGGKVVANDSLIIFNTHHKYIGKYSGGGVILDIHSDKNSVVPYINGTVNKIISLGDAGWLIGGDFDRIENYSTSNIAKLKSDGTVDNQWDAKPNGRVTGMFIKDSIVYIFGTFSKVGDSVRTRVAAIKLANGEILPWKVNITFPSEIHGIIAIDSLVYIYGLFYQVQNQNRNNLAVVTSQDATLQPLSIECGSNGITGAIILDKSIFISGIFMSVNGQSRKYVAKLNRLTGELLPYSLNIENGYAKEIALFGQNLLLTGTFTTINDSSRRGFAVLDTELGIVKEERMNDTIGIVSNLQIINNDKILFHCSRVISHYMLYNQKIMLSRGLNFESAINLIEYNGKPILSSAYKQNTLFIGGEFRTFPNYNSGLLAALNKNLMTYSPFPFKVNGVISDLHIFEKELFIVGDFYFNDDENSKHQLSKINLENKEVDTLWPAVSEFGNISKIFVKDSVIIIIGNFSMIGDSARRYLAMLDFSRKVIGTDLLYDNPNIYVNCAEKVDSILFIGGNFQAINGITRNSFAAFSLNTGELLAIAPNFINSTGSPTIYFIKEHNGKLFVAGNFHSVYSNSRAYLAAFDLNGFHLTPWSPRPDGQIYHFSIDSTKNIMYLAGSFAKISSQLNWHFGAINFTSGAPMPIFYNANGIVNNTFCYNNEVYINGYFSKINDYQINGIYWFTNEVSAVNEESITTEIEMMLQQNYPNPFNPTTTISYQIPSQGFVEIKIYDILGKLVTILTDEEKQAGKYSVHFDASKLASGIYFCELRFEGNKMTKKLLLIK